MALLFVLMVLVLTVASVGSLARISVSCRTSHDLDVDKHLCDELNRAAHLAILQWLQRDAARAVAPVDALQPRIKILDDHWTSTDESHTQSIRISAWDQLGMVPLSHLRQSSPLASVLADGTQSFVLPWTETESPGIDQLPRGERDRFPCSASEDPAIGALVATHNPRRTRRGRPDSGAINVNTAPISLVEAAMRLAGRDGIDQVIDARSSGKPANAPGGSRSRDPIAPRLTSQSDAWSFRVDIQSGPVKQSWWCVFLYDGSRWSLAQRLVIDE